MSELKLVEVLSEQGISESLTSIGDTTMYGSRKEMSGGLFELLVIFFGLMHSPT